MSNKILKSKSESVDYMLSEPVGKLVLQLAVPTVISMMITAVYNMADTFFVSKLGTSASGAVGIIFSLMAIIQAVGFTIGMGSGSILSRKIGARQFERAREFSSTGIVLAFSLGTILAVIGIININSIAKMLGATETILPYARDYARFIILGCPFMVTSFVMNNQLRFQGKAFFSMIGLTTGGILNIFLDPLFIFVFNLGISGAAIATLISQIVSFSILLSFFLKKSSVTPLSLKNVSKDVKVYTEIIKQGFPSFCRQGLSSISTIFLNVGAAKYGALAAAGLSAYEVAMSADAAVAGMSITNRVFMFLMSIALGLGQGFQPVSAMNFGAQKFDRVKEAYKFLVKTVAILMTLCGTVVFIFAPEIVRAFRNDALVIETGSFAMRAQAFSLPLLAAIITTNMLLQTTGMAKSASFLSALRQGIYFIPLILILPLIFGLRGIQTAQAISDFLTAATSIPFAMRFFKNLNKKAEKIEQLEKSRQEGISN